LLAWPTFEGRRKEVIKEGKKGRKKEREKERKKIVRLS
jgi:hypothetical protein